MQIVATQYQTRQSPRKIRLVADAVKGLSITNTIRQLSVIDRRSSEVLLKVLRQALANAQHNHGISGDELRIVSFQIMEGPRYRRFQPVSRGRAHGIIKKTSHVRIILESLGEPTLKPEKSKKAKTNSVTAKTIDKSTASAKQAPETATLSPDLTVVTPTPQEIQKTLVTKPERLALPKVQPKRMRQRRTGT